MKEMRSGSQILFGHLPEQTVDAAGGIWKVKRWNNPANENAVDVGALREELTRAAYPWSESGKDGGFVNDLFSHRTVKVKKLNRDEGIWCEPFPRLYLCKTCKRLHDGSSGRCECGAAARRGQLPFVGFHEACGSIKTPYVKKCSVHQQRAVRFPGTASAAELIFYCPVCQIVIQRGFGANCDCDQGGTLSFNVHRSGIVFKPRSVVVINPPRREIVQLVDQAGGGDRALEWILEGMPGRRVTDGKATNDPETIRRMLRDRGFDESTINSMIAAMPSGPLQAAGPSIRSPAREPAIQQARQIALATFESRRTIAEMATVATTGRLAALYRETYPLAINRAGIERVELIDRFPVLTGQYGYTRGTSEPGESRLRTYREPNGEYIVYGDLAPTEALFIRLDPLKVHAWLRVQGVNLADAEGRRDAAVSVLDSCSDDPNDPILERVQVLVHSYSHALIRRTAVYAGIERDSISELLLPHMFGFFMYAAARGDFVLGGLQALFESDLHLLLEELIDDEQRCALDPGCGDHGAACAVCLHLGEPSCRMFNTKLSRHTLAGGQGFFDLTTPA
jgi:hypothetical protein